ncbi:MAG: hypothetical protein Q9M50_11130 [Methylococcales bacterium]|nr:hypothetical protein [Methylococcales bacterium]
MNKYFWLSVPESDLKNKYDSLKDEVINDTDLKGLLNIETKDNLLKVVKAFQKILKYQSDEQFFKSEKHKFAFLILKHQGNIFDEELGIKKKHYIDKNAAKEWKTKFQKIFHPDKNIGDNSLDYDEVMQKINKIYNRMVGKA